MRRSGWMPASVPKYGKALFQALQFQEPGTNLLRTLDDADWRRLLHFTDPVQLTLTLRHLCRELMPGWVVDRVDKNSTNNAIRLENTRSMLFEIVTEFESRGINYAVLKGFTHSPDFTPDAATRAQSDCDLLVNPYAIGAGNEVLVEMGFVPVCESTGRHTAPMLRPSRWRWRGDYFALDLPISVDLHYKLWDEKETKIVVANQNDFWDRRIGFDLNGRSLPALCLEDRLAFAALHLLMHLLHGDLRLHRAWEISHFLHRHSGDQAFWRSWERLHQVELRRLQAVIFSLVSQWFACDLAPEATVEVNSLSAPVQSWIEQFGWSPVRNLFVPNRDELWLHLALVNSPLDKSRIFLHRLFPLRMPRTLILKNIEGDPRLRLRRLRHLIRKVVLHFRSIGPTLINGIAGRWRSQGFAEGFSIYLASSVLFDAGAFIFVLLYNFFLLDHGFRTQLIGQVNGAMTAGTLAAAIPAAWITRRFGLRNALLVAIVGASTAAGLRALVNDPLPLMATAFLHGMFFSVWAVCYSPTVAAFTNERNRTFAFSLTCSLGMSLGIAAGFIGGRLPAFIQSVGLSHDLVSAKQYALLAASALILLAAAPISRLRISSRLRQLPERKNNTLYPGSFFFLCFLVTAFIWSLATNAFNPFFNTYFVDRYHMTVERIGSIFSFSQAAQVIAVFFAPAVLRWLGEIRGIAVIQLTVACMLALLGAKPPAYMGAAIFIGYMSFQYMTAPSLFSLIMSHVSKEEQSGASALYFVLTSSAAIASALVAGAIIDQHGYSPLLCMSASLALFAALLTAALLPAHRIETNSNSSRTRIRYGEKTRTPVSALICDDGRSR